MKEKLLIDIQLFPSINYIKNIEGGKIIVFEQYDSYQKTSFRNRYTVSGANGLVTLTIPIRGGREQKILYKDVRIDYSQNWSVTHWRTLVSSYNKSPYFSYYSEGVHQLLFSEEDSLLQFNLNALSWLYKQLQVDITAEFSTAYLPPDDDTQDFRGHFSPKITQTAEDWQPRYAQVFEDKFGFQPNLSVLDVLFCEGPNAGVLIKKD